MKSWGGTETFPGRPGLLGHQGGWDEILLVVGPLVVVGLLLWLANRRVSAQLDRAKDGGGSAPGGSGREPGKRANRDRGQPES